MRIRIKLFLLNNKLAQWSYKTIEFVQNNLMLLHINVLLELSYVQKSSSTKPFIGCKLNICLLNVAIAKILPLVGSLELGLRDLRNKAMNCLIETLAKEKAFRRKCKIIFMVALVQ